MSNLHVYQKIFRSVFYHSGIRAFFSTGTALLMLFIVRWMGPRELGEFSFFIQVAVTFGLFLSWGWSGTLSKFLPELKAPELRVRLSSQAAEVTILSLGFFVLIFLSISFFYPKILPIELKSQKTIFITFVCLFALFNVLQGVYRGAGKFVEWSFVEGLNDLAARVFTLLLLIFISPDSLVALYCFTGMLFISTVYSILAHRNQFRITDLNIDRRVMNFGLTMLLGSVIFMVGTSSDMVLLRALLKDPQEVGYYFAGIRIPQIFQSLLLAPLSIPFVYYFSHPDTLQTREAIARLGTKLLGLVCGAASLFLFSFGGIIVKLFYGHRFENSIQVLKIYCFVFFLVGLQAMLPPFLMAINKIYLQVWTGVFSIVLLLGLDFYLIPRWKSCGSALANILMLGVQAAIALWIFSKNGVQVMRTGFLLASGIAIGVSVEILWFPYASLPFFLLFIVVTRLFSRDEVDKINFVIFKKAVEAQA